MIGPRSFRISVGLEQADDGTTVAHALSLPGCSASGASPELALARLETTLREWLSFLAATGERVPPESTDLELSVDEWIATGTETASEPGEVCFAHDRHRLEPDEVDGGLRVLGALRGRILPHVRRVPEPELEAMGRPEWNVRVLLNELARAQWWTLSRLGASSLAEVPERTVQRLDTAMALVIQRLTQLTPAEREATLTVEGEEWTARRVLRRLLWLEWNLGNAALEAITADRATL